MGMFVIVKSSLNLCGNQPVSSVILRNIAETFVNLHAIEQMQLRGRRRVNGVGHPRFDFHTSSNAGRVVRNAFNQPWTWTIVRRRKRPCSTCVEINQCVRCTIILH